MSYAYQLVSATNDFPLIHFAVFPHCDEKHIALLLCFEDNTQDEFKVVYKDNGDDTVVGSGTNSLLVRGRSYIDVMKDDMLEIWTNAKFSKHIDVTLHLNQSVEENLETANGIYEQIKTISRQQHRQFSVYTLFLDVVNHPQLPSILQCFDPNALNKLAIALDMDYENSVAIDLTDIVEMDHWKIAKSVQFLGYLDSIPLEHFRHFQEIQLQFWIISAKDIQNFLEVEFDSPYFRSFTVSYMYLKYDVTDQLLDRLIGPKQINQDGVEVRLMGYGMEFQRESNHFKIKFQVPNDPWKL